MDTENPSWKDKNTCLINLLKQKKLMSSKACHTRANVIEQNAL